MKAITLTKKQIRRIAVIGAFLLAAIIAAVTLVSTSVKTEAAKKLLPIYSVECAEKKIAVTFDVAWENSNTDALLKTLKDSDAKATFFITGDWCDRYPEDVKKFADAGHEIENHSNAHPHVMGINVNELIEDTRECNRKIKMLTGLEPTLYRAPYGEYDDSLITTLDGMGMKVIQWDVDSVDWKKGSAEDIKKKVLKGVKPGSILLFHNDLENTTAALPEILSELKKQGYSFVPVNELILKDNYTIDSNGRQLPAASSAANFSDIAAVTDSRVEQVLNDYSDILSAYGITSLTEEQTSLLREALKRGDISALPEEIKPFAAEVMARITEQNSAVTNSGNTGNVSASIESK